MIWTHLPGDFRRVGEIPVIFRRASCDLGIRAGDRVGPIDRATGGSSTSAVPRAGGLDTERNGGIDVGRQSTGYWRAVVDAVGDRIVSTRVRCRTTRHAFADHFALRPLAGKEDPDPAGAALLGVDRERPACSHAADTARNSRRLIAGPPDLRKRQCIRGSSGYGSRPGIDRYDVFRRRQLGARALNCRNRCRCPAAPGRRCGIRLARLARRRPLGGIAAHSSAAASRGR